VKRLALLCALTALVLPQSVSAWTWPVDGPVLRPFVFGADPYAGGQHRGIDVAGDVGVAVRAPAAGAVTFAGSVPNGGRAVTIRAGDYAVTLLQLGSLAVARGDDVAEGAVVGHLGADTTRAAPRGSRS